jgi:hypothetical protein
LECKRRCPFPLSGCDRVNKAGNWGPKRFCSYLNNWNLTTMLAMCANHDFKLIMSGKETATLTYYIANYATKKQQKSSNVSALLAESLAYTKAMDRKEKQSNLNIINKRLIHCCANSLTRYRKFSAPEIMTYIRKMDSVPRKSWDVLKHVRDIKTSKIQSYTKRSQSKVQKC